MKIFDCVPFFDENMMLDLRFNILNEHVDKFVIVEQLYTHRGEKKKQNFDIKNFNKFKDKIIYFLLEEEPKDLYKIDENNPDQKPYLQGMKRMNSLKRINLQYNKLYDGLNEANGDDLILVSDCDEIPDLTKINFQKLNNEILLFKQKIFYYKFNLLHESIDWYGTKACKMKNLKNIEWLKYIKNKKYPFWRIDTFFSKKRYINTRIVDNGGWHFTNIKNYKDIYYKLKNYGEYNEFEESNLTPEDIKKLVDDNYLYFNHNIDKTEPNKYSSKIKLKKIDNETLPAYLKDNLNKYNSWFV